MYFRAFLFAAFFIISAALYGSGMTITHLYPAAPYVGGNFYISGKGFGKPGDVALYFNGRYFEYDSLNILSWSDERIVMILPELPEKNTIKLKSRTGKAVSIRHFQAKRLHEMEYFNPIKYRLKFTVDVYNIKADKEGVESYLYLPQPTFSDDLVSSRVISIEPEPDYIQNNGIMIYKLDSKKGRTLKITEELEVVTTYSKIDLDRTSDYAPIYEQNAMYQYYTREQKPHIIPNHPVIKKQLRKIIGSEKRPLEQVKMIYNWIRKHMTHEYPPEDRSPLSTLESGKGDCLSDAYLFTSLVRAAGIPVRLNSGYIFYHTWKVGGLHFWEEVFIPRIGWLKFDISYSHSQGFLTLHEYPTKSNFYIGGIDGRRMAFSRGRVKLMLPDENDELTFFRYLDFLQVPVIFNSEGKRFYNNMKNRLIIEEITPLYTEEEDWFREGEKKEIEIAK